MWNSVRAAGFDALLVQVKLIEAGGWILGLHHCQVD